MSIKRVLFPTDFSHTGDAALEFAASLASAPGCQLLVVHVQEPPVAYAEGEFYYGVPEPDPEELMRMLHKVKPADPGIPVEYRLVPGNPVEAIVRLAREEEVDLIVLGSHGRTGLSRMLMGSVAEGVVRRAECAVLVCKQPIDKRATAAAS